MILALLFAQITPVQPLPKGTGLPPAADTQADTAAVLATVNSLFAALTARDKAKALTYLRPDGAGQAVMEKADGTRTLRHMTWPQFLAGIAPTGPRFVEALTDPAVEVDDDIAMVWSPYTATLDGKLAHCGIDHFDLVRENGRWAILNITWTQRTTGCSAQ